MSWRDDVGEEDAKRGAVDRVMACPGRAPLAVMAGRAMMQGDGGLAGREDQAAVEASGGV